MPLENKLIVAIDDTHSVLTFLRISLEALGAKFHGAATAAGGVALCETMKPDLILLDLGLPDKGGFNILPRLKHVGKNTPVVVLTAQKDYEAQSKAMELGASAYVTKPFIMDDLTAIIFKQLRISPSLRVPKERIHSSS